MDILKIFFRISLIVIVVYPNFIFLKNLKKIGKYHFKHVLFYIIMSLIFPCSIIVFFAVLASSPAFIEFSNLDIYSPSYTYRIIIGLIIFPSSIITNIYVAKIYLKRISKTKNEIELIGTE